MSEKKAQVVGVNGNMLTVEFYAGVSQNEVAYIIVGEEKLKGEVIRVRKNRADIQIFENANGIGIGDAVEFTGRRLSVELGPGLMKSIYDGLQNPLELLGKEAGIFLKRGLYLNALDREKRWQFTPGAQPGDKVVAGDRIGSVPEGIFKHYIMTPFALRGTWTLKSIVPAGEYGVADAIAECVNEDGETKTITMMQEWPVKVPIRNYAEKILPNETLVTGTRVIDTFFPVARGGTFCTPGPFGAGKTVLQQTISQHAEVDVVIVAACGERAGEVVDILREFPHLEDPRTGRTLMDRSIIICNTSSMPVAAREASIYTAVTVAEYYRQLGLHTLLLADSTSRWAQALREMSGRLGEIPGEEAFPAYLESRVAAFYERAGLVRLRTGETASVTIGGAVSPAGGNFEEPVTQSTLKVVGCFLALSRNRSDARRYPAIDPLESWSKYSGIADTGDLKFAQALLARGDEINKMMRVIGEEGTAQEDFIAYLKSEFLDYVYLQQNTFDEVDCAVSKERQMFVFDQVLEVLKSDFEFADKTMAHRYFMQLRQLFIDWNYTRRDNEEFAKQQEAIRAKIREAVRHA